MDTLFLTKEARIYNGEKKTSSVSGAGKSGLLQVKKKKKEIRILFNATHKNKLKMN